MALYINTNVASLTAQRNLTKTSLTLGSTFQRLSSGLRVNSARDDAAGLAIGSRLAAQIRALNQAVRNSNDAISLAQVAEGALDESLNALLRIRELAVQAANDTNYASDRANLDAEVEVLVDEVERIAEKTTFNQTPLLNNTNSLVFHVGAFKDETISLSMYKTNPGYLIGTNQTVATVKSSQVDVTDRTKAEITIAYMDTAIANVNTYRAGFGAKQNQFQSIINNLMNVSENLSVARSRIMDADLAAETAALTRNSILQQAGTAVLAQANQQPQLALQLLG